MSLWGWVTIGVLAVLVAVAGFVGFRLGLKSGHRHPGAKGERESEEPKEISQPGVLGQQTEGQPSRWSSKAKGPSGEGCSEAIAPAALSHWRACCRSLHSAKAN